MNPLIKKEIRLLLPSFVLAGGLALANLLFPNNPDDWMNPVAYGLACLFCPAMVVMLALNTFGGEISAGTFSTLLAQPVSRQRLWQTKIVLLLLALLGVGLIWCMTGVIQGWVFRQPRAFNSGLDMLAVIVTYGLVVFSGSLWTVLLLRQVAAAFWFTLLVPGMIGVILMALLGGCADEVIVGTLVSVLGLYSLAGYFFARWLFFRAQDWQWSGGAIVMPELRGVGGWKRAVVSLRQRRPRAALWRKEFMLHQAQFVMALALALLHLGVLAVRHFCDLKNSPDLKFVLEIFWGLWLVMPLLIGCAAVAEERKLGTLAGQLCLPVKRRTQFAIKFSVVIFLSVLLGALVPLLLEGTRILPGIGLPFSTAMTGMGSFAAAKFAISTVQIFFLNCFGMICFLLPVLTLAGIAALIGMMAFHASSLARNTLQTLAPAVLELVVTGFLLSMAGYQWQRGDDFLWSGPLVGFIAGPLLLGALIVVGFKNFQVLQPDWKNGAMNLARLVLALALGLALTAAVYHRAWEKLTPGEPPHGVARLALADPPDLRNDQGELSVRLPDGTIRLWPWITIPERVNPLAALLGNFKMVMGAGQWINGSNWVSVNYSGWELMGIKADGTLWVSENPRQRVKFPNGQWQWNTEGMNHLVPFGTETNWRSLVHSGTSILLVKSDGTLWRWGVAKFDLNHQPWPGLRTFTPQRLGTESNWAEVFQSHGQPGFRKRDGSGWATGENDTNRFSLVEITPGLVVHAAPELQRGDFRSGTMISHSLQFMVGIRTNGSFRIFADQWVNYQSLPGGSRYGEYEWRSDDWPIGQATNWLAVAGSWGDNAVTLKADGTLWRWHFFRNSPYTADTDSLARDIQRTPPVRLGTHADWVAIAGYCGNVIALAADGSLWFWPLRPANEYYDDFHNNRSDPGSIHPLLDISRKPQLLGNVFGSGN